MELESAESKMWGTLLHKESAREEQVLRKPLDEERSNRHKNHHATLACILILKDYLKIMKQMKHN